MINPTALQKAHEAADKIHAANDAQDETQPDIEVSNQGSIVLLKPLSQAGKEWVEENIGKDNGYQPYWPTVVVEHRYVQNILDGMTGDGLEVA